MKYSCLTPWHLQTPYNAGFYYQYYDELFFKLQGDLETLFTNTEFVKIPGKSPELIFYNKDNEELERLDISNMLRSELVELLDNKGIPRKPVKSTPDEVDEGLKMEILKQLKDHQAKEAQEEL